MGKAVIVGAGAVGRGFVAPLLARAGLEIHFVEKDARVREALAARPRYVTAVTRGPEYDLREVGHAGVRAPDELPDLADFDAVFICVGPRNYLDYAAALNGARAVFALENDRRAAEALRERSGNGNVRFGIPDAIVSSTTPERLIARDPLCVVAEPGALILEAAGPRPDLGAAAEWAGAEALDAHWACKFYIHNAPHAVAAYLGAAAGCRYVHEAMAEPRVGPAVERAMRTVTEALVARGLVGREHAHAYLERELRRFRNPLLHDAIARVARDPLRKLGRDDRLAGAVALVAAAGLDPAAFLEAIAAALGYPDPEPPALAAGRRKGGGGLADLLRELCGMEDGTLVGRVLSAYLRLYPTAGGRPNGPSAALGA